VAESEHGDDDGVDDIRLTSSPRFDLSTEQRLTLVIERQNNILRRLKAIETRQENMTSLLNKGAGAVAVVTGAGIFIGWLLAVSGNVWNFFK
jgi:hypothetical protein